MRKIIKGKVYDTDTAKHLATYESYDKSSVDWYTEELYIKKTGEYFLYGTGGAGSQYCEPVGGNAFIGSAAIMPYSYEDAREWAESHLDADEYEALFEVEEEHSAPNRLQEVRERAGMKQKELAEKTGISLPTIQRYEYQTYTATVYHAIAIAKVFGLTVEDIWD